MALDYPTPLRVEPKQPAKQCVIWLHGLGANGFDFLDLAHQLESKLDTSTRFILPHAPEQAVTVNGGMQMPAWYDIYSLSGLDREDKQGLQQACDYLDLLINEQIIEGMPAEKITLIGFSQGGAVVFYSALRSKHKVKQIIGLSTYLPAAGNTPHAKDSVNGSTSIHWHHGTEDTILPVMLANAGAQQLQQLGYNVKLATHPMAHELCQDEIALITGSLND